MLLEEEVFNLNLQPSNQYTWFWECSINPRCVVATIRSSLLFKLNLLSPEWENFAANLVKSRTPQQAYKLNRGYFLRKNSTLAKKQCYLPWNRVNQVWGFLKFLIKLPRSVRKVETSIHITHILEGANNSAVRCVAFEDKLQLCSKPEHQSIKTQ